MCTITVPGPNALVDLWQVAQSDVVGMCPLPCGFGVTPANGVPVTPAAWHVVQPLLMPLWFIAVPAKLVKADAEWHVSHAALVGTWLLGLVLIVTPVKLFPVSWQVAHPEVIPVCTISVPGPNALVDLWHSAQSDVVGMWPEPCGFGVTPAYGVPVTAAAWQVVQPLVIPAWFIAVPAKVVNAEAE